MATANRKIGYDEVVTRDIKFDLNKSKVGRHWFNGEPWTTHWMNAVLSAVPDAERWVMNSARAQLDKIEDPVVKNAALEFIRQERIHAREHDIMNAAITENGLPLDRLEKSFKKGRHWLQKKLSVSMQGSIAASFEHFTAVISSVLLEHPEVFKNTNKDIVEMLYWHFVEETEHKSVSFDVFNDACGGGVKAYGIRIGGMAIGTSIGIGIVLGYHSYLLWEDRQLLNVKSAKKMSKFLLSEPGILTGIMNQYLPYFHPNFHPWDDDNREVIQAWKNEYEKSGDTGLALSALCEWLEKNRPLSEEKSRSFNFEAA